MAKRCNSVHGRTGSCRLDAGRLSAARRNLSKTRDSACLYPYFHSIILKERNALNFRRKIFLLALKATGDLSNFSAFDLQGKSARFEFARLSTETLPQLR
jgi:hypothetical protein